MKISEFAQKYGVKKSAVRYYTDKKLLYPKMKGSSYDYDEKCDRDMKDIMEYKELGFSIADMLHIIPYKRFADTLIENELEIITNLLDDKKKQIQDEIEILHNKLNRIDNHKDELLYQGKIKYYGYPLECVDLLTCPHCSKGLNLTKCEVTVNGIMNGQVFCPDCNYIAIIEKGILNCRGNRINRFNKKEVSNHTHQWQSVCEVLYELEDYFKANKLFWEKGKIFLFNGADTEIITMSLLNDSQDDKIYIFIEQSIEILEYLKRKIELKKIQGKFIFICHNDSLPLKNCVDRLVDIFGINMNAFYSSESSSNLEIIKESLLTECQYLGAVMLLLDKTTNKEYNLQYFDKDYVDALLRNIGIQKLFSKGVNNKIQFQDLFKVFKNNHLDIEFIEGITIESK